MSPVTSTGGGTADWYSVHPITPSAPNPNSNAQTRQLFKECQDFEGLLISELWSQMQPQGMDIGNEPGSATMQGFGIQEASQGVARAGGFGLARMLYNSLAPALSS
jgi:Rod binding domain-containing protein